MKRILLVTLMLLFIPSIYAYDINVEGVVVEPSTSTSVNDGTCQTGAYFMSGKNSYLLGLRISFYDNDGKQIGTTIDVWNQQVVDKKKRTLVTSTEEGEIAKENGYELYKTIINHAYAKPTRIDYYNGFKFDLTGSEYHYYIDNKAPGNSLFYTKDAAVSMKKYFTTPEVVQRYMNITGAANELDVYQGNYTILLETLVKVGACGTGKYGGIYTVADFGSLVRDKTYINNYNLRCNVVKYLSLSRDGNIGTITFKKPDLTAKKCGYAKGNYTPDEVTKSNLGVGMGFVYGTEVCKESCNSIKKYKVIYHTIDLNNPFLTENGDIREISNDSNWCEEPNANSKTCKTTFAIDKGIYSKTPFLTVTLTPSTIRKIKKDNKNINYSNITNDTCENFWTKFKSDSMFSPNTNFCK